MSGLSVGAGKTFTCKHLMRGLEDCVFCQREQYKTWWERDSASLSVLLSELSLVRAIKKDLQADNASLRRQNEHLAAALFRHACYCGCGSPEPALHREDCAYRVVACIP